MIWGQSDARCGGMPWILNNANLWWCENPTDMDSNKHSKLSYDNTLVRLLTGHFISPVVFSAI